MLAVDLDTPLSEEQLQSLADSIAKPIVGRGLAVPAVLFLEMYKPLSFVASQSLMMAMPFLAPFIGAQRVADLSKVLKDRDNVELLLNRIEDMANDKNQAGHTAGESGIANG